MDIVLCKESDKSEIYLDDKFKFLCERKTKMKINIVPLEKIEIDGKSIEFGMKKD